MNFQWILLAIFLTSLISEIAKAITRPMLKNVLRLISIPVAFIITYIMQIFGLFQWLTEQGTDLALGYALPMLGDQLPIPAEIMDSMMNIFTAFFSNMLSPVLFVTAFSILLFLLRTVHVNLLIKFINNRAARKEKKELKAKIKSEKSTMKKIVRENEEKLQEALEEAVEANNPEAMESFIEAYEGPDEDDIEDLVDKRVKKEKKKKKKSGYFKESPDKKTISLACGAVSGFLILAITLMPMFYGMSVLSAITDGIKNTDGDDTKIYQVVDVIDKHLVTPYEESFVIELYDSMALIDLMNSTARAGGKVVLDDGQVVYVDDSIKKMLTHTISAVAEITSGKSEQKNLPNDISVITNDPIIVDLLTEALVLSMDKIDLGTSEGGNPLTEVAGNLINHYKTADKAVIKGDINAISDTALVLVQRGILFGLISGEYDPMQLLEDQDTLSALIGSMSGLSVYETTMEGLFSFGINMLGSMLTVPADSAEAYQIFMDHLLESVQSSSSDKYDVEMVKAFVKGCAETEDQKIGTYSSVDPDGAKALLNYMKYWSAVQKAFMQSSEDLSLAYFSITVDGKLYMCNLDKVDVTNVSGVSGLKKVTITEVTDPNAEDCKGKISPIADLIHYIAQNSTGADMTVEKIHEVLTSYVAASTDENSKSVASRILDSENFESKAVTMEKMQNSTNFKEWSDEEKKADSEKLVSVIFSLLGVMENLHPSEGEGSGEEASVDAMLQQFVGLGKIMDVMSETTCLKNLPPLMLEALVKNEMFSKIITPVIVNQINEKVQENPDLSYEQFMKSLADLFGMAMNGMMK